MADKSDKKSKLKARLPRGLADRGPAEIAATREMVEKIRVVFERYGFEPLETPAIEYTDALGKFLPDQDRPNEGVFSFQDDDEQWLSLRYDLTAPLARYVAENFQHLAMPFRSYRAGYVFRNEKPGPGRFRQFMQFDADTVGSASMAADAEMCMLAADTMEALGLKGQYIVKVNNRKVLDGLMESIDFGGDQNAGRRLTVLRAIDKYDRLGAEGVRELLGAGRKDESGDFTKGAGLSSAQADRIMLYVNSMNDVLTLADVTALTEDSRSKLDQPHLGELLPQEDGKILYRSNLSTLKSLDANFRSNALSEKGIEELYDIFNACRAADFGYDRVRIDPSVVRGLEYYTGPVYEVELLIETKDEKGRPIRFGSVGGGGRYDGLVARFMGQPAPATGFSIGVSRLQAALTLIGELGSEKPVGPVLVTVFPGMEVADLQKHVAALRNAGIRAELYLGSRNHNLRQQLKYADKRGAPCAVIQGPDEKVAGTVTIKDLAAGAALASDESARQDYLQKQTEAQVTVPESQLVEAVKKIVNL